MPSQNKVVSIVIPTKNGGKTIRPCLESIFRQTYKEIEVIIIDSGSTDDTLQIVHDYPVRLFQIKPEAFNHGKTRNLGVTYASGEFIVMTVQDAIPAGDQWLDNMLAHFDDPLVAGVCGQQIVPHDSDKNPHQWFKPLHPPSVIIYHFPNPEDFTILTKEKQKEVCSWDDVNAIYRKTTLVEHPFQPVMYGEDMAWAKEIVLAGYKIIYDEHIKVNHYHHYNFNYKYKITLTYLFYTYSFFGYIPRYEITLSSFLQIILRNLKYRYHIKWMIYNFKMLFAIILAEYHFKKNLHKGKKHLYTFYYKVCPVSPISSVKNNQTYSKCKTFLYSEFSKNR